jgi:hypothetical protein
MDDPSLLRGFRSCELHFEAWNHRLHLRVAYLHLASHPFGEALPRLRAGIRAYNHAHEVPDHLTSGYHETLTVAWLRLVAGRMASDAEPLDSGSFCDAHADLLDKSLLRLFYSRERLVSWEAKRDFLEPDLQPLPAAPDA